MGGDNARNVCYRHVLLSVGNVEREDKRKQYEDGRAVTCNARGELDGILL